MKILYYFRELQTPMYQWQRVHIFDELKRHGCHIEVFNPLGFETIEEANEELLLTIKNSCFDLFMTPHGDDLIYKETISEISRYGVPTLLICFDSLMTPLKHKNIVNKFDLVFLSQQDRNGVFQKYNCKYISSPYAANPYLFQPKYKNSIPRTCFVGTPYGSRVNTINHLLAHNIPLDLYANISMKTEMKRKYSIDTLKTVFDLMRYEVGRRVLMGGIMQRFSTEKILNIHSESLGHYSSVDLMTMNDLFSNYDLSLSISAARNTGVLENPVHIVHLRNFEIPMCGGLQICAYFAELSEYFEEDREIIFYRDKNEFIDKTKFYLKPKHESLRKQMKAAARKRAESEHTWYCRFKKAFDYLNIKA